MRVYTYSEARQRLATVLDQASKEGEVWIKRKDGQVFVIKVKQETDSPLNVTGIDLNLNADEILTAIQRRSERILKPIILTSQGTQNIMTTVGGKFTLKKRNLVTYIEDKQYEILRELAAQHGSSVSAEAALAIQNYISQNKEQLAKHISRN